MCLCVAMCSMKAGTLEAQQVVLDFLSCDYRWL